MAEYEGNSSTITFGTSSWSANITSIDWSGISRESIETSHLGTTTDKTYIAAALTDPGELSLTVNFDPDTPPPYQSAAETVTLTFPVPSGKSTGATYAATGFITSFSMGPIVNDGLVEANVTVKFSDAITQTDSAV